MRTEKDYQDYRYHVIIDGHRTTVMLDNFLSHLLAIKLGHQPNTPQAHRAVRHWLQKRIDRYQYYYRSRTSQWLAEKVLIELIPKELEDRFMSWYLERPETNNPDNHQ